MTIGTTPPRRDRLTALLAGATVAATTALTGGATPTATAVPGGPPGVFDASSVGWSSFRDQSSSAFSATFHANKKNNLPVDLEIDTVGSAYRVGSVWQRNSDERGWLVKRNLTSPGFNAYWTDARASGYRLVEQETYRMDGDRRFAGLWIKNTEGFAWASHRGQTNAQFLDSFEKHRDDGLMPVDFDQYQTADGTRYSTVWVARQNRGWKLYRNRTSAQWSAIFTENRGYRVISFESLRTGDGQRYGGIFVTNDTGRGHYFRRDLSARAYDNWWYRYKDMGYRLVGFDRYETAEGTRYAGMWRQNSGRPDWALRADVDQIVQEELDTTGVPGISVSVYQNGQAMYLRGFGNADIDDGVWMDSTHVGSVASVSKTVGGVLTMRMIEQDAADPNEATRLDLDDRTSEWVPGLPTFHKHTVGDLASNRGCIRHYADGLDGFTGQSYDTALDAAEQFWDDDLVCDPASGDYSYSTHGFTLLGAALEGAGGDDIKDLVRKRLSNPFNLGTLRPQDTSVPHRMTIYGANDAEVAAPNNDWKVLGGGIDSSVADLGRYGAKLVGGQILSDASLDTMWTPPNGKSSFAYGWSTGTEAGSQLVAMNGSWTGNLAALRMFPDEEIVVAVQMNDRSGDQSASQVAREIATLVRNSVPAP